MAASPPEMEEGEIEISDDDEQKELELALAMSLQAESLLAPQVEEPARAHKVPNGILQKGGVETEPAAAGRDDDAAKPKRPVLQFGSTRDLHERLDEGEVMEEGQEWSLRTKANSLPASEQGRGGQGGSGGRGDVQPRKEEMQLMAELGVAARSQVSTQILQKKPNPCAAFQKEDWNRLLSMRLPPSCCARRNHALPRVLS
jgi:hypothetical protein